MTALAACAALAAWLYLLVGRGGFWRMREAPPARGPAQRANVVAVVPARNEADVVERAVESLQAQKAPGEFRIVLVDDGSTDGTAERARSAAPMELLAVLESQALPAGWTGKLWALHQGIQYAERFQPDFLWLTDADIVHPPGSLAGLVARAEDERCDLVSLMATLHCRSFAERALIPAFVFFFFMLYPPAWIRDPRREVAGAAGGCMLVRRSAMDRIGGVAAIRGEWIDDCALAAAVKEGGGRVWLGLSRATRSIRPYRGWGELEAMIARTAFTQLNHSVLLLAVTAAGLIVVYLAPPLLTFAARPPAKWAGAAAWLLMSAAYYPTLRFYRAGWIWAPLLPLTAAFYLASTLHSAAAHWRGRGGQWKGRAAAGS